MKTKQPSSWNQYVMSFREHQRLILKENGATYASAEFKP